MAALLALSGCGDGGDGSRTVTLEGNAAVEASVGVGLSTGNALATLFLDVELSVEEVLAVEVERVTAGGGAGSVELDCDAGGSQSTDCEVGEDGTTTLDLDFDDCRSNLGFGHERRRDGHIRLVALDPLLCVTARLGNGVPFSLEFDGFRSTIVDGDGERVAALTANLTEEVLLEAGGCLTSNGSRSATGSLDVEIGNLVDFSLETTDLHFDVESDGSPCKQTVLASGSMTVEDRVNRLRFSQVLDETEITLGMDGDDILVAIDGEVGNDCLGNVHLTTTEPVRLGGCPAAGSYTIVLSDGAASTVDFDGGGVDFDFGDDGTVDKSVSSCRDASLAQCVAE
jgi:hypothetical protein